MNFDHYRNKELNDYLNQPDTIELHQCEECGAYFETLNTYNDFHIGNIEVCDSCLTNIKQQENAKNPI